MSFDIQKYINHLAEELIKNFDYAGSATTPVLKGIAREKEVINKLEMLLPNSVGVGSGCIIDSFGNTSKQIDLIIYEKEFCPVFTINNSAETTYYPCEGVIATGEVKSLLNQKELTDIFKKAESIKKLQRFSQEEFSSLTKEKYFSFRNYNSKVAFECTPEENFDQQNKFSDQIFCFAICGKLSIKQSTIIKKFHDEILKMKANNEINVINILDSGILLYKDNHGKIVFNAVKNGYASFLPNIDQNFNYLLNLLTTIILSGRTVPVTAFQRYLQTRLDFNNTIDIKI